MYEMICYRFNNVFYNFNMPMFSMIFSFLNMLICAIRVNIFNVYIVHMKRLGDMQRYFSLTAGYMPFYLNSILFRIFSLTFLTIFLDYWMFVIIITMFFSNLLFGYLARNNIEYKNKKLKKRYSSLRRKKGKTGLSSKFHNSPDEDVPVWLNSFLGVFIPCCSTLGPLPDLMEELSIEEQEEVYKAHSVVQKQVIKRQGHCSDLCTSMI